MVTCVLAGLLATVAYSFPADTKMSYDVNVQFDGFLPLMGGNEGKVDIKMGVGVNGLGADDQGLLATSEITEFEVSFNGAKLPLTTGNVVEYFPKTKITVAPTGKILKNDAPDKKLPVRLPGLDIKHFPDVTYVPIELPSDEMSEGKEWKFARDFGGAPIDYTCVAQSVSEDTVKIKVSLKQVYQVLESPTYEVVANAADATSEVTTTMTGEGTVDFNIKEGRVREATMVNTAVSDVKDLKTSETKQRKLATKYSIKLRNGSAAKTVARAQPKNWWEDAFNAGRNVVSLGRNALAWLQTATLFGLKVLPRELEGLRPLVRRWAPWLAS